MLLGLALLMEPRHRVQGLLERTFRSTFETFFHHDFERSRVPGHLDNPAAGDQDEIEDHQSTDPEREVVMEMQTQALEPENHTHHVGKDDLIVSPINPERPQKLFNAGEETGFPDGPSRLVNIEKDDTKSLLFALTRETVTHMITTIRATRAVAPLETELKSLRRAVNINQAHIDLMKDNLININLAESSRQQFEESLQDRETTLQRDVERKTTLERDFNREAIKLRLLKEEMQETFEQILMDANFLESESDENPFKQPEQTPIDPDFDDRTPESAPPKFHEHMTDPDEVKASPTLDPGEAEKQAAIDEYENAADWVRGAEGEFLERQEAYEHDLFHFIETTPKTEIDLFHLHRGRELAKTLNDAEEAWEKAKVKAKALGLLRNNSYQESDFVDDVDDGYRLSQDPSGKTVQPGRDVIEAWAGNVADQESDEDEEMPDVDEWETRTMGPWDSLSVVAEGRQRTRIDRWWSMCNELKREAPIESETPGEQAEHEKEYEEPREQWESQEEHEEPEEKYAEHVEQEEPEDYDL